MARKNLLTGLTGDELPAGNSAEQGACQRPKKQPPPHLGVMGTRGAIGAVTRSIEQLKAHSDRRYCAGNDRRFVHLRSA